MMIKVNYFTNQEINLNERRAGERNYESFGWWLPDLLTDVIHPPIGSPEVLTSEEYDSGVDFERSQVVTDESLTSGGQWDKFDPNSKTGSSENGDVSQNQVFDEENIIQTQSSHENVQYNIKNSVPSNKSSPKYLINGDYECRNKSIVSREELIALINSDLPNSEQLDKILQSVSTNISPQLRVKNSTPCKTNKKIPKTISRVKSQKCYCENGLEALVVTVEHESTDRDLEESRATFLKTASRLDSKLRALEADAQQLHSDLSNLQKDFQVQEDTVTRMTEAAQRLVMDLQNLRYLDDLIFLLQGQLDRITLQNWPFILAHVLPQKDSSQEINLVV